MTAEQPDSICLLRLSALGDVTHVLPLVRTLQRAWPQTRLTWIIGKLEARLLGTLPGVELLVFDKKAGWSELARLRRALAGRRFAALLLLQISARANLISTQVRAPLRIGYDRARSRELHGLFVNRRIAERHGQHVLDAIGSFAEPLGLRQDRIEWGLQVPPDAGAFAEQVLPGDRPTLLLSPCSSHVLRNWHAEGYAAVADHAAAHHGYRVLLCGGRSALERQMGEAIRARMRQPAIDLIGKDTLPQLVALLRRATLVLSPDSGPMHIANAVGTPVLGLHAASNPARSGPYSDRRWCVDRYDDAARRFLGKPAAELRWGRKIERPGVMELISVGDVTERFEAFEQERVRS